MRAIIGILLIGLCLFGCKADKQSARDKSLSSTLLVIDVDKAEVVESIPLSELCAQMKTIILETNEHALITNVGSLQVHKDLIIVKDEKDFFDNSRRETGVYAFNREGKFIRKYGNRGGGPGEYISVNDFTIDTENEIIYLLDDDASQILKYEIYSGKFAGKIIINETKGIAAFTG